MLIGVFVNTSQTSLAACSTYPARVWLAREIGTGRNTLNKGLDHGGNPSFGTVVRVLHALGIDIRFGWHAASAET